MLIAIIAFPLLGTFFPLESYLSAATLANPLGTPVEPGRATTVTLAVLYIVILALFAKQSRSITAAVVRDWPLFAFVGWAISTALWAETPSLSFNRSGRLLLAVLYGIYIAQTFDRQQISRMLCYAILIGLLGSALVSILYPGLSRVTDARGAWRGAFFHKNILGSVSGLGMLFGAFAFGSRLIPRPYSVFVVLSGAVFIVLANSITALLALLVSGGFALYLKTLAPAVGSSRVLAVIVAGGVTVTAYAFSAEFLSLLAFTGRDATLTGRTDVWRFVETMIDLKPIWGWGHGTWQMPVFQSYVIRELLWSAPNAHNAWLDLRLQLGIPGLALGIFIAFLALKRAATALLICHDQEYLLWLALLMFMALRSTTETMFVDPAAVEMFWFTLAFTRLAKLTERGARQAKEVARPKVFRQRKWISDQPAEVTNV